MVKVENFLLATKQALAKSLSEASSKLPKSRKCVDRPDQSTLVQYWQVCPDPSGIRPCARAKSTLSHFLTLPTLLLSTVLFALTNANYAKRAAEPTYTSITVITPTFLWISCLYPPVLTHVYPSYSCTAYRPKHYLC